VQLERTAEPSGPPSWRNLLRFDAGQKHGPGGVDENEILVGESGTIPCERTCSLPRSEIGQP